MSVEVSVIIPTRDRAKLLRRAVASVLAQVEVRPQVIVVDDGSVPAVAHEVAAMAGRDVQIARNPVPRGQAVSRNRGLDLATGRWVAFLDDDDLWHPDKLRLQLAALERERRRWGFTGAVKFADGPVVWQRMAAPPSDVCVARLPDKNVVPAGASNVVADVDLLRHVGGFDPTLHHLTDWDLWLRLMESGPPVSVPGLHVGYRQHVTTSQTSLDLRGVRGELELLDRRWRHLRGGAIDPGPIELWIARSSLRAGQRLEAVGASVRAMRTRPREGARSLLRSAYPPRPGPAPKAHDRAADAVGHWLSLADRDPPDHPSTTGATP